VSEGFDEEETGRGEHTLPLDPDPTGPANKTASVSGRDVLRERRRRRRRGRTLAAYGVIFAGGMVALHGTRTG
jgi:hypothetical protein